MKFNTAVPILSTILIMLASGTALARYDAAGNVIGDNTGPITGEGDLCGSCPAPNDDTGVDFKGSDLLIYDGVIHRYQSCGEVESITLHPPPGFGFDVGYDSARSLYLVTDPGAHLVMTYDLSGSLIDSFPALGNPVGVSYDQVRDLYWACDWTTNRVYGINPTTGVIGPIFNVPFGTRIAGTGYDATNDAIVYNDRDLKTGYWISAVNGAFIASYSIPLAGDNNGQGCGVDPLTTNVWISHAEQPFVYCLSGLGPIAIEPISWGQIKASYR